MPVTINSGEVWPKKGNLIKNKKIIISILKPIETGFENEEFINSLQMSMYDSLDKASNLSSA